MASLCESRLFNRAFTIDDISKKPQCKNLKFKRAFQFLQLLLIQRVYGIDVIHCPVARRPGKHYQRQEEKQKQHNYEVFLGGSCNPTTWRHDQAIPYFQSRSVSFYNPQVANWTPDLVEIEHRAKELAPLLFFVIDYDTRALASIVEVCYLAARGRSIIVVMNPMPEKNQTKFIQQKKSIHEKDDEYDYENVCEARRTLRTLLRSINIPVFDNVRLALECAAFILESTNRTVTNNSIIDEDNTEDDAERDTLTPLPMSPSGNHDSQSRSSSVVYIRSLSNKTAFATPDDFYRQMQRSEVTSYSPTLLDRRRSASSESANHLFHPTTVCTKTQLSCSTNESDDDGYCSLASSNRTLSISTSSISSEPFESTIDHQRDDNSPGYNNSPPTSLVNNVVSTCYSYIPFVSSLTPLDSSVTQSLFVLLTLPFRFMKDSILSTASRLSPTTVLPPLQEPILTDIPSPVSSPRSPHSMFDLYIASGENDECWLNTFAIPTLEKVNVNFTKRQYHHDNDQLDALYDMHVRKQSRVLYYLINGTERLSHLSTELAFLIGERKHKIIVYLQLTIEDDTENILSSCERRDIQRARKYLEDLARKENITLFHSREQSWQQVLAYFCHDD